MVLLGMTRRESIHAVLRIARQGYYFVPRERGSMAAEGRRVEKAFTTKDTKHHEGIQAGSFRR